MGVAESTHVVEAKSVRGGEITQQEWQDMLAAYMEMQRTREGTEGTKDGKWRAMEGNGDTRGVCESRLVSANLGGPARHSL